MAGSVGQYTQGWFPWVAKKAGTMTSETRGNDSTALGMGYYYNQSGGALNDYFENDHWMDSVTWKVAFLHWDQPNSPIVTVKVAGSSVGTIDWYAASNAANQYDEITGISISTAGVKTIGYHADSKNASSTGYTMVHVSIAWIRTGGTPSTPAGTDTPGYTTEHVWFMGTKGNTNWSTRTQSSAILGGGLLNTNTTAQNNEANCDFWYDTGTFKCALTHYTGSNRGIYSLQFDAATQGTVDGYDGAANVNRYDEVTGIAIGTAGTKNFRIIMATKNASSSAYDGWVGTTKWLRTGA